MKVASALEGLKIYICSLRKAFLKDVGCNQFCVIMANIDYVAMYAISDDTGSYQ